MLAANIVFSMPTEQDIIELSETMRQCDIDELHAVTDQTVICAVRTSVLNSEKGFLFSAHADGKLLGIGGCTVTGNPWLLATDELQRHTKTLTKTARASVRMMLEQWPILSNMIDVRNKRTIKWLKAIGFTFKDTIEIRPGFPVIRFEMVSDERAGKHSTG